MVREAIVALSCEPEVVHSNVDTRAIGQSPPTLAAKRSLPTEYPFDTMVLQPTRNSVGSFALLQSEATNFTAYPAFQVVNSSAHLRMAEV